MPFKNKLTVPFVIIFVSTLSFRVGVVQDHDDRPQPPVRIYCGQFGLSGLRLESLHINFARLPAGTGDLEAAWSVKSDRRCGAHQFTAPVPRRGSVLSLTYTHTHTHQSDGPLSGTTRASRYQKGKRSSAIIAEGPRDASRQLKSCQLPRNSAGTTCTTSPEQIESRKPALNQPHRPQNRKHTHPLNGPVWDYPDELVPER